ncbi:hypothetical protein FN846DRAFT_887330 [Sphaerosporella brunnea]|uniref:Uncharacterized protein n=1 Tax=Sphaerosporella brunnea TaxID=1250544 RepID=A0A5J5F6I7_9PEZI|nr:hypothetical protein FN846DRAFT_887330 [Sphaerosporella brunnea]
MTPPGPVDPTFDSAELTASSSAPSFGNLQQPRMHRILGSHHSHAKRRRHGTISARLPLVVELADADAKPRKQDASAEVAAAEAVTVIEHSPVEVDHADLEAYYPHVAP